MTSDSDKLLRIRNMKTHFKRQTFKSLRMKVYFISKPEEEKYICNILIKWKVFTNFPDCACTVAL